MIPHSLLKGMGCSLRLAIAEEAAAKRLSQTANDLVMLSTLLNVMRGRILHKTQPAKMAITRLQLCSPRKLLTR